MGHNFVTRDKTRTHQPVPVENLYPHISLSHRIRRGGQRLHGPNHPRRLWTPTSCFYALQGLYLDQVRPFRRRARF
jgi:hypothetical protein